MAKLQRAALAAYDKIICEKGEVTSLNMFIAGRDWQREQTRNRLLYMLNTSIDNAHFFEQLDNYIDELENNKD